jgi:hypothetical protein
MRPVDKLMRVHKANSRDLHYTVENDHQDIVEWWAPSEMKEETANRVRVGDVGTPATLGSSHHTDRRKMVINLE